MASQVTKQPPRGHGVTRLCSCHSNWWMAEDRPILPSPPPKRLDPLRCHEKATIRLLSSVPKIPVLARSPLSHYPMAVLHPLICFRCATMIGKLRFQSPRGLRRRPLHCGLSHGRMDGGCMGGAVTRHCSGTVFPEAFVFLTGRAPEPCHPRVRQVLVF